MSTIKIHDTQGEREIGKDIMRKHIVFQCFSEDNKKYSFYLIEAEGKDIEVYFRLTKKQLVVKFNRKDYEEIKVFADRNIGVTMENYKFIVEQLIKEFRFFLYDKTNTHVRCFDLNETIKEVVYMVNEKLKPAPTTKATI